MFGDSGCQPAGCTPPRPENRPGEAGEPGTPLYELKAINMKRITDVPNTSKEMQKIYDKFWDVSGDFRTLLPRIDDFLQKYPNYTEALVLKARSLMGIGRNSEALKCLKMAKRVDKWRLIGRFDEAEIYLEKKKNEES